MTDELRTFLKNPRSLQIRLKSNALDLKLLEDTVKPQAIVYDRDKVQSSPSDPMLRYIERYEELLIQREALVNAYLESCKAVARAADSLPGVQSMIIKFRFLYGMQSDEIAEEINYSTRQYYRLYTKAVAALDGYMKKKSECAGGET